MHVMRLAGVVVLVGVMAGCAGRDREQQPPQAPPASENVLQSVRQEFQAAVPGTLVGSVVSTLADQNLAAIGQVPADQFKIGQPVVFVDSARTPIATGIVRNIANGVVVVEYKTDGPGQRAPQTGDLMARFPSP